MLPPEFDTPLFCKKSRDPAHGPDENSSMHFTGQYVNEPFDKCSVNVYNHESNYNSDASSMTFAISVSLGLDVTPSSFSTDCSAFQYEPLLADVAPMQLYEKQQAELALSSDQRPPSEQPRDRRSTLKVQNTNAGDFEIRRLIVGDSQTFQKDPSPTGLASIEFANEHQQRQPMNNVATSVNPILTPKIACTAEPSSQADRHPTSVQPIPAIVTIPFLEIQNLPESRKSFPRPIRSKPAKDDSVYGHGKNIRSSPHSRTHPRKNTDEKRFTCNICKKSFPISYNLARHKRIHTGEKKFACDICHKTFTENYLVRRHMTIHTDQKKFACDFCNKNFIRNGSLVRHMRRHTGEKTFACHVCDKKFARDDVLKNHVRTHAVEKNRVSRNDSLPEWTTSLEFDKQQQACIDISTILGVAYPTLMPSDVMILVGMDLRKHTVDHHRRYENLA